MRKIIIEISGGNVQEIYSTEKENDACAVYVIDWDSIKNCDSGNHISEFPLCYLPKSEIDLLIEEANNDIDKYWREYE